MQLFKKQLNIRRIFSLVFLLIYLPGNYCCLLCPLHIPARPKPLDQFRVPSIQKLIRTSETIEWLCQNGSRLSTISPECRSEVSQLFCSLTSFVAYLKAEECPGKEDKEQCVKCRTENERLYNANKWIMTWVDSVGKMPSGISDGNYHWLGDYEQCQRLKTQGLFNGRYCLLEFRVPGAVIRPEQCPEKGTDPLEVVLGICLPANCSTEETQGLVEYVAEHQPIHVNCQPPGQWPLAGIILVGILLLWLSVLLFVSTFRWFHHLQLPPIFDAFCLQIHLRHSLRTTQPLETRFQSIHGIQVLAASFLVLGQAQLLVLPYLENTGHHYALLERWPAQIALNPTLLTDTILALDLFQLALNESQRRPKRSLILIVWKRFLRIWPIYTLITLSMAFVFAHLGEGPMWSRTDISQRCSNNWPENIFFIQNLLGYSHTCLNFGHLISLEAQFILLFLPIFYFISIGYKRSILILMIFGLILSNFLFLFFGFLFKFPPTLVPHLRMEIEDFGPFANFLITPFARASSPIIGLLFALFLLPKWDEWQHLIKALSLIGLLITLFFMIFILWAPFWIFTDSTISLIYGTIHRPIWSFLLFCFLGFLEVNLKGSVLAKLLCWRVFRPLSKLVLIVLLLSEPIALSLFSSLHRPVHTTPLSSLLSFIGIFVCSFLFSFILDCSIIRPIRNLFLKIYGEKNELENNKEEENDEKEIAMEKENILGKSKNEI